MSDIASKYTDAQIKKLQHELDVVYKQAEIDIRRKMEDFNRRYKAKEQIHLKELRQGKITQEDFDAWKRGQVFQGQQWQAKRDQILDTMHRTNEIATNIINGRASGIFVANANFMGYSLEHGTGVNFGFGLYDSRTVVNLIKSNPQILPKWKIDEPKDYSWSQKKLNRSITQGIIQGESLDQIAKRLANKLSTQNLNKMKTFARTAMTGAQNSGRQTRFEEAKNKGIDLMKEWIASLDSHTRDSHRDVDGEQVEVDKRFSNFLMFPGEPGGAPAEVYNCRCTMAGEVKKYPSRYHQRYDNTTGKKISNMSYREWEKSKRESGDIERDVNLKNPVPTSVRDVVDFAGLKSYVESALGMKFDDTLTQLNFESVREFAEGVEFIQNEFPQAREYFTSLNTGGNGIACASLSGKISLNERFFVTRNATIEAVHSGNHFHPTDNNTVSTGAHESGHILEAALIKKDVDKGVMQILQWNDCKQAKNIVSLACKEAKKTVEGKGLLKADLIKQISGYAARNSSECLAEAVADYYLHGEKAAILSRKIWEILKGKLG